MAVDEQQDERRRGRKRERIASAVMALFPLLVAGGFLAPGWVRVLAEAQEVAGQERDVVVDRIGPFARRPLPVSREFYGGGMPELLDLDRLFVRTARAVADEDESLEGFPRGQSDGIVIDSMGPLEPEIAFVDVLTERQVELELGPFEHDEFLPLCGTLPLGNCVRYDDLVGLTQPNSVTAPPVLPIPEPVSGSLLALGLAALGLVGRRATAS